MAAVGKPSLGRLLRITLDAVERGLGGDRLGLAREGEARITGQILTVDGGKTAG